MNSKYLVDLFSSKLIQSKSLAILPIDSGRYGTKEMMEILVNKKVDYQLEIEEPLPFLKVKLK